MTSDEKINYEYTQMLDEHAIWTKSSLYTNFGIKICEMAIEQGLAEFQRTPSHTTARTGLVGQVPLVLRRFLNVLTFIAP